VRKSKGYRSRTRRLFSKDLRKRGKLGLSKLLVSFNPGDRVRIKIDPSVHKGMPHKRYQGRVGIVARRRGKSYLIDVSLGDRMAKVISRPEHFDLLER
jgi:large subunit ribosomal protein L21e